MGCLVRAGVAASFVLGAVGLTRQPQTDAERVARIAQMVARYGEEHPDVPTIDATTLQAKLAAGVPVILVDVRTPAEQAVSMLPGAVPASAVEADPAKFMGRELVSYCTIGLRSGDWAVEQRARGLAVTNLEGSILAWTHVGGALQDAGQPTQRVHVYGRAWALARSDYETVY